MCRHITRTYFHVMDEATGEHITTYTDEEKAERRRAELDAQGRDFCAVVITEPRAA